MDPQLTTARLGDTPIAIIGLGALYPRSGDLRQYWSNIVEAADCLEDVPETHWRIEDHYDPDPSAPDKTYVKRGGFIPTVDFNPMEFGLPPNILEVTDVLQLLSLVVAKHTLADAGATEGSWYDPSRTGCVLGITGANSLTQPLATRLQTPVLKEVVRSCGLSDTDAEEIAAKFVKAFAPWEENSFPGMLGNVVAGRIANRFDLGGTNCTVDAACASSLAAVHMAVAELVSGRADLMLTGGCDAENTILMYLCFSKTPALSKSGVIRPFDENSDGTMIGEGMGMLALKRLADAERDGDRIYSVLRGIGTSSDGRFKSIYAPRKEGQVVSLKRAYADAGFGPEQVGLVECHGTGTSVGDLTELTALREVFADASAEKQFCAVGSVKSQIGHTKAAAGAAGLIKLSLALHQKVLPPTINVESPREAVDFPNSPFWVNSQTRPWVLEPGRDRRRAAISSFGFGGTNFHCVLEEHDPTGTGLLALHRANRVHLWHAADPGLLLAAIAADPVGGDAEAVLPAEHARLAVVASDATELAGLRDQAVARLREDAVVEGFDLPGGAYYRRQGAVPGKVAALFAGQGSQYVGMGAATAIAVPPVRAEFDAVSARSDKAEPLSRVVFPPPAFDRETAARQEEALRRTDYAQPAIGALSAGHYRFLTGLGFSADAVLGHSFGELTALWAAGSLTDEAFHRLAFARGDAMADLPDGADRGAMAAIRCAADRLAELLAAHPDVVVCNLNSPEQTVVGGGTDAVRAFTAAATEQGLNAQLLPVAAAFHTSYVEHAVDLFGTAVAAEEVSAPAIPVYANTADAEYGSDVAANRRVLVEQLSHPVAFEPRVRELYAAGHRVFVEFGPRAVLAGQVRRTLADLPDVVVLSADVGPGKDGDRSLKQLAARLTVLGLPLTGLNRHSAAEPEVEEQKGMRVPLTGVNHVSEERRQAYRDALDNGYRVSTAPIAPAPAAPAPTAPAPTALEPVDPTRVRPAVQTALRTSVRTSVEAAMTTEVNHRNGAVDNETAWAPDAPATVGSMAGDHLALHREYLTSQLRLAERLGGVLEYESHQGGPSEATIAGLTSISDHSVAIGQTHIHASEVLLSFAHLEAGLAPTETGHRIPERRTPIERPARREFDPSQDRLALAAPAEHVATNGANGSHTNGATGSHGVHSNGGHTAGAHQNGTAQNGTAQNGTAQNGTAQNGTAQNGTAQNGTAQNGTAPNGTVPNGSAQNGSAPNGSVPAPKPQAAAPVQPALAQTGATADVVRDALLEIVAAKTGYPTDMLDLSMDVEADLGIDSIKRVEIMGALRERFPDSPEVSPEQLGELSTLEGIVSFISGGAAAAPAVHPSDTQPGASADVVRDALLAIVAAKTGYPTDMLDLSMDVEADLGIDSIKRVEIMGALRERFPDSPQVSPEQLGELSTLEGIVTFISGEAKELSLPKADGASRIARMQARLVRLPAVDQRVDVYAEQPVALIAGDSTLAQPVAAALTAAGWAVHHGTTAPADRLDLVLSLAPDAPADWAAATDALADSAVLAGATQRLLEQAAAKHRGAFVTVSRIDGLLGLSGVDGTDGAAGLLGGLPGLVKTLAIEAPSLFCRAVDLSPDLAEADAVRLLLAELGDVDSTLPQVGIDQAGHRRALTVSVGGDTDPLLPQGEPVAEPGQDDLLVVTGGGRGVTAACVIGLAERYGCGLLLVGRSALTDEPGWAVGVAEPDLRAAIVADLRAGGAKPTPRDVERIFRSLTAAREIRATLAAIEATGAKAEYLAVDVTDPAATATALAGRPITGIVHGAGVLADQLMIDQQRADLEPVLATKLHGLKSVLDAVDQRELRHVLLFTSVAGFFGNRGQSGYAAANEAVNRVAATLRRRLPATRVTSVNWGAWAGGMVTPELERMFAERGVPLIPLRTGVDFFVEQFTHARSTDVVCVVGPDVPLSAREPAAPGPDPVVVRRDLTGLVDDPVLADHALHGDPVLPATAAIGAILGTASRVRGTSVRRLRGFSVLKGVILDADRPSHLDLVCTADSVLVTDSTDRPRYRADVLDGPPPPARLTGLPEPTGGEPTTAYTDGTLFHGPALRGITSVLTGQDALLVLACRLDAATLADGGYDTADYHPVLADLLLQAALVQVRRTLDLASLPAAVGEVDAHHPLPVDEPFLIVVDPVRANGSLATCTVTACTADGRVLLRFGDVELVCSAALGAAFNPGHSTERG